MQPLMRVRAAQKRLFELFLNKHHSFVSTDIYRDRACSILAAAA